jgi:hypothetical protein
MAGAGCQMTTRRVGALLGANFAPRLAWLNQGGEPASPRFLFRGTPSAILAATRTVMGRANAVVFGVSAQLTKFRLWQGM